MSLRRGSITILLSYFVIYFLPSLLISMVPKLQAGIYLVQTIDYLLGAIWLLWVNQKIKQPTVSEHQPQSWLLSLIWGVLGIALVVAGQLVIGYLTTRFLHTGTSVNTSQLLAIGQRYPFYYLAIIIAAPIMEELVFRKVLFGNLVPITGGVGAAVISSILFGFAHLDGHMILYSFIGLFFCWLYNHTGRIQTTMLAHIGMNAVVTGLTLWSITGH